MITELRGKTPQNQLGARLAAVELVAPKDFYGRHAPQSPARNRRSPFIKLLSLNPNSLSICSFERQNSMFPPLVAGPNLF
jgi:hypothetical protein